MSSCIGEAKATPPTRLNLSNPKAPLEDRFAIVVEDPNLYAVFEQYLVTQFSEENLHFYNDVTKLHAMTEQSEIDEVANRLCKEYFGLGEAETKLNVNLGIRNKVLKALEHPTTTMFDEAFNDIEQVLKTLYISFVGGSGASTPESAKRGGFRFACLSDEE